MSIYNWLLLAVPVLGAVMVVISLRVAQWLMPVTEVEDDLSLHPAAIIRRTADTMAQSVAAVLRAERVFMVRLFRRGEVDESGELRKRG